MNDRFAIRYALERKARVSVIVRSYGDPNALRRTLLPETLVGEKTRLKLRRAAGHCATEAAQAFYELYLAMLSGAAEGRAAGDENLRVVFDRASDRVCKSCVLCAQCWQKDYVTTLAALNDVTQPMLARGRAEMQDFPYHFSSRCVHLPELIRAINSALFALRERQSLRRQQEENRSLLARQYAGITDILRQLGAEDTPCIRVFNKCDAYIGILPHGDDIVCISARSGEGADALVSKLLEMLDRGKKQVRLEIPYSDAGIVDLLKREAAVLSMEYTDTGITAEAIVTPDVLGRVKKYIPGYVEPKEDWE